MTLARCGGPCFSDNLEPSDTTKPSNSNKENNIMQLTYRGSQYQLPTSNIQSVPGEVIGKYRGATLRTTQYANVPPSQPLNLVYRGAHYRAVANQVEPTGLWNAI
jgi:hypothetical protein